MKPEREAALLDTSIQIKRVISVRWKADRLDSIWQRVEPIASLYSFMEFKNCLIGAVRFLISVLDEIRSTRELPGEDPVKVRLSEVIRHLNTDTAIREKQRRQALANAFAAKIIDENSTYPRLRSVQEIIEHLTVEADNLEKVWFFTYILDGQAHKMRAVNRLSCHLGREMSPMRDGLSCYHCQKGAHPCQFTRYLQTQQVSDLVRAVIEQAIPLADARLRKGTVALNSALESGSLPDGYSAGERLCLPVGDILIVSKAGLEGIGVMTADKDQRTMALNRGLKCWFHDLKTNVVSHA